MQAAVADWQSAGSIEAEVEKLHTALTVIQQQVRASLQQEAQPQICEAAEKCELLGQELVHLQQANAKVVDNLRGSQNRTAQLEQLITTCSTKRKSLLTAEIAAEEKLQSHYARQLREQHERMQDLEVRLVQILTAQNEASQAGEQQQQVLPKPLLWSHQLSDVSHAAPEGAPGLLPAQPSVTDALNNLLGQGIEQTLGNFPLTADTVPSKASNYLRRRSSGLSEAAVMSAVASIRQPERGKSPLRPAPHSPKYAAHSPDRMAWRASQSPPQAFGRTLPADQNPDWTSSSRRPTNARQLSPMPGRQARTLHSQNDATPGRLQSRSPAPRERSPQPDRSKPKPQMERRSASPARQAPPLQWDSSTRSRPKQAKPRSTAPSAHAEEHNNKVELFGKRVSESDDSLNSANSQRYAGAGQSMDAHHGADHAPGFADTGETSAAANEGEHQQEDAALGNGNADGESEAFEQLLERLPADLRQPFSELDAEMAGLGLRPNTPPIPKASRSTASSPQKGGHDHAPSSHPEPEKLGGTGQLTSQLDFHERRINALEVEKADLEQLLKRTWAMQKEKEEWPHDSQGPPWSSGRSQTSRDASPSGSAANHKPPDSARADSSERKRFKRWSSPSSSGPSVQALQGKVNTLSQRLASTEAHKREAEEQLVQTRERLLAAEHATAQYKAWLVKAAKKLGYLESANLPVSPPHSPRRSTEDFANTLRNAQGAASASSSGQRRASWLDLPNGASAAALRAQRRMSQSVSPARSGRRVSQENANGSLEASPPLSMPRRRTNSMLLRDGTPPKRAGSTTSQALPAAANRLGRRPSISPQRTPDGSPGGPLQRTGSASPPRPPGQRWWRAKDDQAKHETVHLRSSNAERNGGAAREPAADDYKMDGGGRCALDSQVSPAAERAKRRQQHAAEVDGDTDGDERSPRRKGRGKLGLKTLVGVGVLVAGVAGAHFAVAQSQAAARKKGSGNLQA